MSDQRASENKISTESAGSGAFDRAIDVLFSRPWAVSILVGLVIHFLRAINVYVSTGSSYLQLVKAGFVINPASGASELLIPFLVPWVVTSVGRRLTRQRELAVMLQFPEMNPDLVFKLDDAGNWVFINTAVKDLLIHCEMTEGQATELLPNNYRAILSRLGADHTYEVQESLVRDQVYEFGFRWSTGQGSVFVSGRNTTESVRLNTNLKLAHGNIGAMTDFLGSTFSSYDPLEFDLDEHYRLMVDQLLTNPIRPEDSRPTHIFLARDLDDRLEGHIYFRQDSLEVARSELICISKTDSQFAIREGSGDVVWSNWDEEPESLEHYQTHFHPQVRQTVGEIERYVTYQSGQIAIIAFYQGQRVGRYEGLVLKGLAVYANSLNRISRESQDTESAFVYVVEALVRAAEANDEDTGDHIVRINEYSAALAEAMGMDESFVAKIRFSAQMHDVGKIHVHPDILKKPGKLTDQEFGLMKAHPVYGARILGDSPRLDMAIEIARSHHEKFGGGGYPQGLSGDKIPISARIVSIADVYDALRQKRVYKPAFSHEKAIRIITDGDGRTSPGDFDPRVLKAFVEIADEMNNIFERFQQEVSELS